MHSHTAALGVSEEGSSWNYKSHLCKCRAPGSGLWAPPGQDGIFQSR